MEIILACINSVVAGYVAKSLYGIYFGVIIFILNIIIPLFLANSKYSISIIENFLNADVDANSLSVGEKMVFLTFGGYKIITVVAGFIMAIAYKFTKILIAFCIWVCRGGLFNQGDISLIDSIGIGNIVVDIFNIFDSIRSWKDNIIQFFMNIEANILGITDEK